MNLHLLKCLWFQIEENTCKSNTPWSSPLNPSNPLLVPSFLAKAPKFLRKEPLYSKPKQTKEPRLALKDKGSMVQMGF